MTTPDRKAAIIIVSWNTQELLVNCLNSLLKYYPDPDSQIIVVDNASKDDSVELVQKNFPTVQLLCNDQNLGFAKACNQGIAATDASYILLLNSDCELVNDCITPLLQVLEENKDIGVAGSILLYPNGKIQKAGGVKLTLKRVIREQLLFESSALFAQHPDELEKLYFSVPFFKSDFISGASLCVRRNVLEQIGLLREDFFMYGEDLEFCMRAQRHGFSTVIVKESRVIHYGSQSTNKNLAMALQHSITNNSLLLVELEGPRAASQALVYYFFGSLLRMLIAPFRRGISTFSWAKIIWQFPGIVKNVHAGILKNKQGSSRT